MKVRLKCEKPMGYKSNLDEVVRIPKRLLDVSKKYPPAAGLYIYLKSYEGRPIKPQQEMAEDLGWAKNRFAKAIRVLKEENLLYVDRVNPSEIVYWLAWDDRPAIEVAAVSGSEHANEYLIRDRSRLHG